MAEECPMLVNCGFFKKYDTSKELACLGFINQYCRGEKKDQCRRKEYKKKHGVAPTDDMLPNGRLMAPSGD